MKEGKRKTEVVLLESVRVEEANNNEEEKRSMKYSSKRIRTTAVADQNLLVTPVHRGNN